MSAYMCNNTVLSIITDGIMKYAKDDENLRIEFGIKDDRGDPKVIFEKLFQMNLDALIYRYGEETAESMYDRHDTNYCSTTLEILGNGISMDNALYAALATYLYQCNEGNVSTTFTYTVLSSMHDRVAHNIVKDSLASLTYDLMMNEISRW